MPAEPLIDEDYDSEEDSDFAPDAATAGAASQASESDDDDDGEEQVVVAAAAAKRKRVATAAGDGDDPDHVHVQDVEGFENSGDEAVIARAQKRRKKSSGRQQKDGSARNALVEHHDHDGGGEGGFVKTRSMRAVEKAERKTAAVRGPVTVDVDDLWAQMIAGPIVPSKTADAVAYAADVADAADAASAADAADTAAAAPDQEIVGPNYALGATAGATGTKQAGKLDAPPMIKIKRTYNFAGKVHTEEKVVARDSAEARLFLASQEGAGAAAASAETETDGPGAAPRRQPRKAFRSVFEPVLEGAVGGREDLKLGISVRLQMREQQAKTAKKVNVVEKSRMDWAGFVDKEGIKDELELAGKSKESYAGRQDFLARSEAKREEDARRARMAARV